MLVDIGGIHLWDGATWADTFAADSITTWASESATATWEDDFNIHDQRVLDGQCSIHHRIEERSTAEIQVYDPSADYDFAVGQEVKIFDNDFSLLYGGVVTESVMTLQTKDTIPVKFHSVRSSDYHAVAEDRIFNKAYITPQANTIVYDILLILAEEGITEGEIQAGDLLQDQLFSYVSCAEALDKVAGLCAYTWWISEDKKLYFVSYTTYAAAWSIAGDPGQKLVIGAQYAANALISAGQSIMSMARSASTPIYYPGKNPMDYYFFADGGETTGPQLAMIGEEGKEYVIPTKKKRWDLLLAAMKAYGIKGFAEGGEAGAGTTTADVTKAVASVTVQWDIGKLVKQTQSQLKNLQDYFRTTWSLIQVNSQGAWINLIATVAPMADLLKSRISTNMMGIRSATVQTWADMLAQITLQVNAIWPAIEPSVIKIHDSMISSFGEMAIISLTQLDAIQSQGSAYLQDFANTWTSVWPTIDNQLQNTTNSVQGLVTQLQQLTQLIQQLNSMSISVSGGIGLSAGGGGGGGDSGFSISSGAGSNLQQGAAINGGAGGFIDVTCMGDAVIVNPLKYTNPSGYTSYINPMTYIGSGGISGYQGVPGISSPVSGGSGYYGGGNAFLGFAGGGIVPADTLAKIHANEMVLPPRISQTIMSLADAGVGSGGGVGRSSDDRMVSLIQRALSGMQVVLDHQSIGKVVVKDLRQSGFKAGF